MLYEVITKDFLLPDAPPWKLQYVSSWDSIRSQPGLPYCHFPFHSWWIWFPLVSRVVLYAIGFFGAMHYNVETDLIDPSALNLVESIEVDIPGIRITSYNVCYTKLLRRSHELIWNPPILYLKYLEHAMHFVIVFILLLQWIKQSNCSME